MSIVPEALSDLTELGERDLSGNYLKELPTSIKKIKSLKADIRGEPIERTFSS